MYYLIYVLTILLLPVILAMLWTYELWKKYKGYVWVGGGLVLIVGHIGGVVAWEWVRKRLINGLYLPKWSTIINKIKELQKIFCINQL